MKCVIIRHGLTISNIERRFSGCGTDDPLTPEGIDMLRAVDIPEDIGKVMVFASPMKRTKQTAGILFPEREIIFIDDLREMHFGRFENRNHYDLDGDPEYQAWIDSMGTMQVPDGESRAGFTERIMSAFREVLDIASREKADAVYIVAHGGTVMAIMHSLFGGFYYDYHPDNGCGYTFRPEVDDAGNIVAAGSYDSFRGGIHSGSDDR